MKKEPSKYEVVKTWRKAYTEALIDFLHPFGDVLEIGYGAGFAAHHIQTAYHPKSHTIIEPASLSEKETAWVAKHKVSLIHDTWENGLSKLGVFDTIFLNDYSPASEMELTHYLFPEETTSYSSQTKEVLSSLEEQFSRVKVHYSDQQVDEFYKKIGQFKKPELARFFYKLKANGNISGAQYENALKKYGLEKEESSATPRFTSDSDRLWTFLKACTKNHLRQGSRFSCFSSDPTSKYDNPQFFEHIITSADFDYQEKLVSIEVPAKAAVALILVVEKVS